MKHELFREDYMMEKLMIINNLHWDDSEPIPCIIDKNDDLVLDVDDFVYTSLDGILTLKFHDSDKTMYCDGVLFFGDGTIEFHDADTCEAFNWEEFDEFSLLKVERILRIISENK